MKYLILILLIACSKPSYYIQDANERRVKVEYCEVYNGALYVTTLDNHRMSTLATNIICIANDN